MMNDPTTMHARFRELIAEAQAKLDEHQAEHGGDEAPSDLLALRHQLNVTDWYLSAALHEVADRLDALDRLGSNLSWLMAKARTRLDNLDGGEDE